MLGRIHSHPELHVVHGLWVRHPCTIFNRLRGTEGTGPVQIHLHFQKHIFLLVEDTEKCGSILYWCFCPYVEEGSLAGGKQWEFLQRMVVFSGRRKESQASSTGMRFIVPP